jgi:hypothetical protein
MIPAKSTQKSVGKESGKLQNSPRKKDSKYLVIFYEEHSTTGNT